MSDKEMLDFLDMIKEMTTIPDYVEAEYDTYAVCALDSIAVLVSRQARKLEKEIKEDERKLAEWRAKQEEAGADA